MTGSISINTQSPERPRARPEFSQRASGKAWNQALWEVGFDNGPKFQDMDDIRFDGKRYEASCTTNIKQEVDKCLGESRYALHPAVVDSTLQLSIAAIYAGRTDAVDCRVAPAQVDKVVIWPPSRQQIKHQKAFAVQMTAADGNIVMEIVNIRTTGYEAAIPQRAETTLKGDPYSEMAWRQDFGTLTTPTTMESLTIVDVADLALFKHPSHKLLEVGFVHTWGVLKRNLHAIYHNRHYWE
ncbi:polyketide synthase dehydratase-domain-containing protein [Xylaria arbuscula]|nr:polyketide synthase dehydratase-domain-containing protein [Xylaria arbuscula]